jgi:hypothetical protein
MSLLKLTISALNVVAKLCLETSAVAPAVTPTVTPTVTEICFKKTGHILMMVGVVVICYSKKDWALLYDGWHCGNRV